MRWYNLGANKIHAGDIAAERMEANIVCLTMESSRKVRCLAAVRRGSEYYPGALLTEHAIAEMTGVSVWIC